MKTHLDLFSGIGGFALAALENGFDTVAFCEIEPFAQKILRKNFPDTPIHSDINQIEEFTKYAGKIDLLTGGFPCQPFSIAGQKKGTEDHRDLWPAMLRVIQQVQPTWIIGENVAHFTNMAFSRTKTDLENQNYTVRPYIIPAAAVGSPQRRDRVWIIAYSNSKRCAARSSYRQERSVLPNKKWHAEKDQWQGQFRKRRSRKVSKTTSDNWCKRVQRLKPQPLSRESAFSWCENVRRVEDYFNRPNLPEPLICGSRDGISHRVDRTRALGNAIVPQVASEIIRAIVKADAAMAA